MSINEIRSLTETVMEPVIRRADLEVGPVIRSGLFAVTTYSVGKDCTVTVRYDNDADEWKASFARNGEELTEGFYPDHKLPVILKQWQAEAATAWPRSREYAQTCVRLAHRVPELFVEIDRLNERVKELEAALAASGCTVPGEAQCEDVYVYTPPADEDAEVFAECCDPHWGYVGYVVYEDAKVWDIMNKLHIYVRRGEGDCGRSCGDYTYLPYLEVLDVGHYDFKALSCFT